MSLGWLFLLSCQFLHQFLLSLFLSGWGLESLYVHHMLTLSPWRLVILIYSLLAYIIFVSFRISPFASPFLTGGLGE